MERSTLVSSATMRSALLGQAQKGVGRKGVDGLARVSAGGLRPALAASVAACSPLSHGLGVGLPDLGLALAELVERRVGQV